MTCARNVLIIAALLLCASSARGQWEDPRQPARDSLKGLKEIVVAVDYGFMDAFPDDPTEQEIKQTVERFLTDAGMIVKQRPYGASDNYPTLVVSVFFMNYDIYYHHMALSVKLTQVVTLPANPALKLTSATWDWGSVGTGISTYPKRDEINELVAEFICDFRRANPEVRGWSPACQSDPHLKTVTSNRKAARIMTAADEELIRAAALNETLSVRRLLARGADPNAHDPADTTVWSYSVRSGNRPQGDTAVAEMLLSHGANPKCERVVSTDTSDVRCR